MLCFLLERKSRDGLEGGLDEDSCCCIFFLRDALKPFENEASMDGSDRDGNPLPALLAAGSPSGSIKISRKQFALVFLRSCTSSLLQVAFPLPVSRSPDRLIRRCCPPNELCKSLSLECPPWTGIGRSSKSVSLMLKRSISDFFCVASSVGDFCRLGICKNISAAVFLPPIELLRDGSCCRRCLPLPLPLLVGKAPENEEGRIVSLLRRLERDIKSLSLLSLVR